MPARQRTWVAAIQKRVALTVTVLNQMSGVNLMGLNGPILDAVQGSRRRELDLSKHFRQLVVFMNAFCM